MTLKALIFKVWQGIKYSSGFNLYLLLLENQKLKLKKFQFYYMHSQKIKKIMYFSDF